MEDEHRDYSVIMACGDKRHAFQTARAAAERSVLDRFITGLYYRPNHWFYRFIDKLLQKSAISFSQRLHGYRDDILDNSTRSIPWLTFTYQFFARLPSLGGRRLGASAGNMTDEVFDSLVAKFYLKPADIFHGFARYSQKSLVKAKSLGAVTILDQPEPHPDAMRHQEVIEYQHAGLPVPQLSKLERRSMRRRCQEIEQADYIFVGLDFVKRTLVDNGIPAQKIIVIPYGTSVNKSFHLSERPKRRKPFTILHVGALTWFKGLHYLLDAFERLQLPDARLVIIGRGHPQWAEYFQRRIKMMPTVEWVPGVPQSTLFQYYAEADLFVFPSLVGGVGLVVFEAMSTGLPVIVSDGDVIIRDEIDGLVTSPTSPGALESAMTRLYYDDQLRETLGRQGQQRVQEFSWDAYRQGVAKAYDAIMSKHLVEFN